MNELINIQNQEGQLVVSSRQVAEHFDKQHKDVLESIRSIQGQISTAEFSALFILSSYKAANGKNNPEYLLTRDGFTLLAMGFTGSKALEWKLKYIEAFNKMEQQLTKPMCIEDLIIANAQALKEAREQAENATKLALEAKEEIQGIRDTVVMDTTEWRTNTTNLINKIATYRGGTHNIYQETRQEIYQLLDKRFAVNLEQRLINKRRRMADEGICKSKRDKLTKVDVIAEDKKLIEGYVQIVKEMAIKYGVA